MPPSAADSSPFSPEQRYRLLATLGRLINSSLDLRRVFRQAADEVHRLLGCDRVHLILVEAGAGTWRGFAVEYDPEAQEVDIPCQTLNQSAAAWVLRHRQPRIMRTLGLGSAIRSPRIAISPPAAIALTFTSR